MHGHRYTQEEQSFFAEFIPGHTYKEIQEAFIKQFNWDITVNQIKGYMANHKINSGTKGYFRKGHIPANKGTHNGGWKPTQFKKGHVPANRRPVGTESLRRNCKRGQEYVYVKVAEPNKWKMKHVVVWEQHNGPVPKGKIIIFLDGNSLNTDISNLMLIDRGTHAVLNRMGLRQDNPEGTKAAIGVAQLSSGIFKASKKIKRKKRQEKKSEAVK